MTVSDNTPTSKSSSLLEELGRQQRPLLEFIDTIQAARPVNIKLPQIAVVGPQSAGKSSLLEALSGVEFERDATACTRFATELRLRHAPEAEAGFQVKIIPDPKRSPPTQARMRQFGAGMSRNVPFQEAVRRAKAEITANSSRFATHDKLVVEYRGPKQSHLTLVDLPGLILNKTDALKESDMQAIEALTDSYMRNPRTIILAVVSGGTDLNNSPIMKKVRQFDEHGLRTIGVVTKPDSAVRDGLGQVFLDLVNNRDKENQLKLGWHVILGSGPHDPWTEDMRERREEEFFSQGPFSSLPASMTRISSLIAKLGTQLTQHIAAYLPKLRAQVQAELDSSQARLSALGHGRDSIPEMRQDLAQLLNRFSEQAANAVDGNYGNRTGNNFFPKKSDPKGIPVENLRARVVKENKNFAKTLRDNGHSLEFMWDSSAFTGFWENAEAKKKEYAETEVAMRIEQQGGVQLPDEDNYRIPYDLFHSHSEKWRTMAQTHVAAIVTICDQFVGRVLEKGCPVAKKQEPLQRHFLQPMMAEHQIRANQELDQIVKDLEWYVQPYDDQYVRQLDQWRQERYDRQTAAQPGDGEQIVPLGPGYTPEELVLERSLILYRMYIPVFIRNVIVQVVERHFMEGIRDIFSSDRAMGPALSDEQIEEIAADDAATKAERRQERERVQRFTEALAMSHTLPSQLGISVSDSHWVHDDDGPTSDDEEDSEQGTPSDQSDEAAAQRHSQQQQQQQPPPTPMSSASSGIYTPTSGQSTRPQSATASTRSSAPTYASLNQNLQRGQHDSDSPSPSYIYEPQQQQQQQQQQMPQRTAPQPPMAAAPSAPEAYQQYAHNMEATDAYYNDRSRVQSPSAGGRRGQAGGGMFRRS